ncbi:hypothetical protein PZA11_006924 [Diplocarpon coronariae]
MSTLQRKLAILAIPLLLLALTAIAGYAHSQIRSLSIPIPPALALCTVVLPIITGLSAQSAYSLVRRAANAEPYRLRIPLIAVIGIQLICETIIATLALTHILPASALDCGLQSKWLHLHRVKDADAIRAIQDSFSCCGLHTVRDHSWPFSEPPTCASVYHRSRSCIGAWRKAEQSQAGLLLLVAVAVFIIKVLLLISLLTNAPFTQWASHFRHPGAHSEEAEEDNRATMRRLIEENAGEYQDEPSEEPTSRALQRPDENTDRRPVVLPRPLTDGGHEWRTCEGTHDLGLSPGIMNPHDNGRGDDWLQHGEELRRG